MNCSVKNKEEDKEETESIYTEDNIDIDLKEGKDEVEKDKEEEEWEKEEEEEEEEEQRMEEDEDQVEEESASNDGTDSPCRNDAVDCNGKTFGPKPRAIVGKPINPNLMSILMYQGKG